MFQFRPSRVSFSLCVFLVASSYRLAAECPREFGSPTSQGSGSDFTLFVDDSASGANDGSSWFHAYTDLQDALLASQKHITHGSVEIRVAQGTYKPDRGTGDRDASFDLAIGLDEAEFQLLGGYAGITECDANQRDPEVFSTILSGDLLGNDGPDFSGYSENSNNVVTCPLTALRPVVDGFTITHGYADRSASRGGGGIWLYFGSAPTIRNCRIVWNLSGPGISGGAVFGYYATPTFERCAFEVNRAGDSGGALYMTGSMFILDRCEFIVNRAADGAPHICGGGHVHGSASPGGVGGALGLLGASAEIHDSLFAFNLAGNGGPGPSCSNFGAAGGKGGDGGAIWTSSISSLTFHNCTFVGNRAGNGGIGGTNALTGVHYANGAMGTGGGIFARAKALTVRSCIFWENMDIGGVLQTSQIKNDQPVSVDFSVIKGWTGAWGGVGNFDEDPMFEDSGQVDFRLRHDSPAINAGDPAFLPLDGAEDIGGLARIRCGRVDIGANEFPSCGHLVMLWPTCMTGPLGESTDDSCNSVDTNGDGLIDLWDMAAFQDTFGP